MLRAEIKARGLTHAQLAAELGISRVHVTRLLSGARSGLAPDLERLIEHLGFQATLKSQN